MRALAFLLGLLCFWQPPRTVAEGVTPSDAMIVATAQQFVLEHLQRRPENYFDVAFDIANIHPQADPGYWAVIGGFMADAGHRNYKPHAYGVAMRVICSDYAKPKCWRLEKLVIDQTIILNN